MSVTKDIATENGESKFSIPVVDFLPFQMSEGPLNTPEHEEAAKALDRICRNEGFVCLRNSGIPKDLVEDLFRVSKDLFGSPEEQKKEVLLPLDPKTNYGYCGFQGEALNRARQPDLKEAFNIRKPSLEGYPGFQGTSEEFQRVSTDFWNQVTSLGRKFSVCCAMALGLDHDYFSKGLAELDQATLRLLHYPPCPEIEQDNDSIEEAIRVGEHTDFGIFTFLFVHNMADASSQGLQVKPIEGGDLGLGSMVERDSTVFNSGWKDVVLDESLLKEIEGDNSVALLVNTGALLARWTNDTWRATAHRVVVKPQSRDFHRYSIATFFDPDKNTMCTVDTKFVPDGMQPKYPPISSFEYLMMKLREAQEIEK